MTQVGKKLVPVINNRVLTAKAADCALPKVNKSIRIVSFFLYILYTRSMSNNSTESNRHWVVAAWYKIHVLQVNVLLGTPETILNANQMLKLCPAKPAYLVTT